METKEVKFKRFIASEGKALKWKQIGYSYCDNKIKEFVMYAEKEVVIDTNTLVGEVEEIPFEEYKEWLDNNSVEHWKELERKNNYV